MRRFDPFCRGQSSQAAALLLAFAVPVLMAGPARADRAMPAPISDRYRAADRFLRDQIGKLVVDSDLGAVFTQDGTGIVYRTGAAGKGAYRLFTLRTRRSRVLVEEPALARLLSAQLKRPVAADEVQASDLDYQAKSDRFRFHWNGNWALTAGTLAVEERAGKDADPGLSPDGKIRIIARGFNLFAVDLRHKREVALTRDGTPDQPYGRGIAELSTILAQGTEDPVMPVSIRWSPDSRYILTWRLDTRGVHKLTMTQQNPPGSFYPRSFSYVYPLAGAPVLPKAQRLIVDVSAAMKVGEAQVVPVGMPAEELLYPADPDMSWIGDHARAQWTERGYGKIEVYNINPATGAARVVAREAVKPLVTVTSTVLQPAAELGGDLVISERSGWAQLYLVRPHAPDDGVALTHGSWEVLSVDHVDANSASVLATGIGREGDRNPYWRQLYRIPLAGGEPRLLTPEPLDHDTHLSDDGRFAIDRMSSPTEPTRTVVRDLTDGRVAAELGRADPSALRATGYSFPEPFQGVATDGRTPLYAMIYRPAHFDPGRKYPVIDFVYTGPTTSQVPTTWDKAVRSTAGSVAQIDAILVMIDGRGTSRSGQAFRLPAYQNLGEVGLDDHIAIIRQIAARYPEVDASRAGVYGCSAGGYDAARFILRRPDFFKVAVAVSGNHDERLDKAWWPEVSMGNAAPELWDRNSNMAVAGQLKGKLLLVHGDLDDNVPVTETYRLQKALIDAGKDVDMVILPNARHCEGTPYFWRKLRDYFVRNLLDEPPPAVDFTLSGAAGVNH